MYITANISIGFLLIATLVRLISRRFPAQKAAGLNQTPAARASSSELRFSPNVKWNDLIFVESS